MWLRPTWRQVRSWSYPSVEVRVDFVQFDHTCAHQHTHTHTHTRTFTRLPPSLRWYWAVTVAWLSMIVFAIGCDVALDELGDGPPTRIECVWLGIERSVRLIFRFYRASIAGKLYTVVYVLEDVAPVASYAVLIWYTATTPSREMLGIAPALGMVLGVVGLICCFLFGRLHLYPFSFHCHASGVEFEAAPSGPEKQRLVPGASVRLLAVFAGGRHAILGGARACRGWEQYLVRQLGRYGPRSRVGSCCQALALCRLLSPCARSSLHRCTATACNVRPAELFSIFLPGLAGTAIRVGYIVGSFFHSWAPLAAVLLSLVICDVHLAQVCESGV